MFKLKRSPERLKLLPEKLKFLLEKVQEKDAHIEKTGPKEILWFVALWVLGVASITFVGLVIKSFLGT